MYLETIIYNNITFNKGDEFSHEDENVIIDIFFKNKKNRIIVFYTSISPHYPNNMSDDIELFYAKYHYSLPKKYNYTLVNPKIEPCCKNCDTNPL
jgi:hypothetical protein